eukprot:882247-Alexandrium_andersonii.AAC.1
MTADAVALLAARPPRRDVGLALERPRGVHSCGLTRHGRNCFRNFKMAWKAAAWRSWTGRAQRNHE